MQRVTEHQALSPQARTLVTVGLLGGFTTFSAFGYETLELLRGGSPVLAITNVAGNVVLGTRAEPAVALKTAQCMPGIAGGWTFRNAANPGDVLPP